MGVAKGLGRRIKDTRTKRGMSQTKLADLLHVSGTAVWNWEANGVQPRQPMLAALAKVLGVSVSYLLTGQDDDQVKARTAAQVIRAAAEEIAELNGVPVDHVQITWRIGNDAASGGGQ